MKKNPISQLFNLPFLSCSLICSCLFLPAVQAQEAGNEEQQEEQNFDEELIRELLPQHAWQAELLSETKDAQSGKVWFEKKQDELKPASARAEDLLVELQTWELGRNDAGDTILLLGFEEMDNPEGQYSMKFILLSQKEDNTLLFEVDVEHVIDEIAETEEEGSEFSPGNIAYEEYIESLIGMVLEISPSEEK